MNADAVAPPTDFYLQRISSLDEKLETLRAKDLRLSRARLGAFLLSLGLFLAGANGFGGWLILLAAVAFLAFVAVVRMHDDTKENIHRSSLDRRLAQWQIWRIARSWDELGAEKQPLKEPSNDAKRLMADGELPCLDEFVVQDLDFFGPGSLWHLVNRACTPLGEKVLADWLRNPADKKTLQERQEAIQFLASKPDFCHDFALVGSLLSHARGGGSLEFLEWSESGGWLRHRVGLMWLLRALGCVVVGLMVGVLAQWLAIGWSVVLLIGIVINVVLNMLWIGKVHDTFNQISSGKHDLHYCNDLFQNVAGLPKQPAKLGQLKSKMRVGSVQFEEALKKFWRILRFSNGRKSGVFAILWLFAQILFFWDFHVLFWLEHWQRSYGNHIRAWFEAVAELEALNSLATVAHDHPHWSFVTVSEEKRAVLHASQLGHPLLSPGACVRNDIDIGPSGTFLLVTGSNMSGKSTLLRSIGLNEVLGLAGAPVCAESMSTPIVVLATSMRITDSLNSGVSFFMAELKRVKSIVDRARLLDETNQPRMLFLLDEILQGTNSAERHVAVARILRHLLATQAIGAISTHDLELADSEQLKSDCQTVHLRETIIETADGEKMEFDYVVRPGVTPTTNALRLLEMVGLSEP